MPKKRKRKQEDLLKKQPRKLKRLLRRKKPKISRKKLELLLKMKDQRHLHLKTCH